METVIHTENLSKYYGEVHAAENINLEIRQGEIYGFLGLNGAGKTTTIRMLLGMIKPVKGSVYLFGEKLGKKNFGLWNRVGHLVEIPYSYPELTVRENLEIYRRLRFLNESPDPVRAVMEKLRLLPYANTRAKNLSLGNAQRLGIAKAMIHQPGLLVLDEPANGLDPEGIVEIREMLSDLAGNHGVTVFISSHILGEISRFATRIGIIHEGNMIRESEVDTLDRLRYRALKIRTLDPGRSVDVLRDKGYELSKSPDGSLEVAGDQALKHPEEISALLASAGLPPTRLLVEEEDLESYFLRIIHSRDYLS